MHPQFERLFSKLVRRWKTYQDAPRHPDLVATLAAARANLDDTRQEISDFREQFYPEQHPTRPPRPGVAVDPDTYLRIRISGFQDSA
jgi:hypothetical protein